MHSIGETDEAHAEADEPDATSPPIQPDVSVAKRSQQTSSDTRRQIEYAHGIGETDVGSTAADGEHDALTEAGMADMPARPGGIVLTRRRFGLEACNCAAMNSLCWARWLVRRTIGWEQALHED